MARIFTIYFGYKEETFTAVILILNESTGPVSIYVPDQKLHDLLPFGRITLTYPPEIQGDIYHKAPVQELLNSIFSAISAREEKLPPVSLW
jgi:hypothetical protein